TNLSETLVSKVKSSLSTEAYTGLVKTFRHSHLGKKRAEKLAASGRKKPGRKIPAGLSAIFRRRLKM
ncbi:hypothetical protein, partial [Desulfovibrio porci]|uniref:hypothetical protein n=1 Tax=Desulfovibrio porci TaxID=2605782 RepID=UPI003A8E3D02